MNRIQWGPAAAIAGYCLAVISVWSIEVYVVSGSIGLDSLYYGAFIICFLAWPILAFVGVRLWISKGKTETSGENGTRFGKFVMIVFAVVAACIVWLGQLAIGSRMYPFTSTFRNSLDLFLGEVAMTVLAGLLIGLWTK